MTADRSGERGGVFAATDDAEASPMDVETAYLGALPKLRRYVRRILGETDGAADIDDIVQETYVRARRAKEAETLTYATAYLFRVARNLSFKSKARRKSAVLGLVADFAAEGIMDDVTPADEHLHQKRRFAVFQDAVQTLPPQCRQVFVLRQLEGLSHQEISKRLGISTSTVEKHLAKGLRLCANFLRERGYDAPVRGAGRRDGPRYAEAGE